ncbi:MAG: hypothetical protein LUC98_12440 [Lachnospiraceae bacterium]|nr:hypothetical protein [Lachnospiraceae bacterium]
MKNNMIDNPEYIQRDFGEADKKKVFERLEAMKVTSAAHLDYDGELAEYREKNMVNRMERQRISEYS